jgi:peptidoglycan/LPS O-acetylase OafA/YrhL
MSCGAGGVLDNAVMRGLGTISYSMYLWHFAFCWAFPATPGFLATIQAQPFPVLFAFTLALSALCATATYLLIERPGIRLGAALLRSHPRGTAPQLDPSTA